ncbi:hypothetical protein B7494_g5812 [Chlorociboria aeruginascens]|nr:hypothetical protein B7494_g5812 [Chlorociboria aeruginascens]
MARTKNSTKRGRPSSSLGGSRITKSSSAAKSSLISPNFRGNESSAQELSDDLINFVSQSQQTTSEPPRKRQKSGIDGSKSSKQDSIDAQQDLDFVVVRKCVWEVEYTSHKLSTLDSALKRDHIHPHVSRSPSYGAGYIQINDDNGNCLENLPLPPSGEFEDIELAIAVHCGSNRWAKEEGKLWTEFAAALCTKGQYDCLQIHMTIKWNTTSSPSRVSYLSKKPRWLPKLLSSYFPDPSATEPETWSAQDFYQCVQSSRNYDDIALSIKPPDLETELYPFQKMTVQWLLQREGVEWTSNGIQERRPCTRDALPVSFIPTRDSEGRKCYVSHLFGLVTLDPTPFSAIEEGLKGGILAEEMGLGKTVEIISLVTLHKRHMKEPNVVLNNSSGGSVRNVSTTLIITPSSILQQWISEINKHAPHLNVMHYKGIKAHGTMDSSELMEIMAGSDIVVSTYSVLAAEINFTQLNPEKSLRKEPKYPRPKSPLMQLSWFRVCIDEAQMLQSGVTQAAMVARLIPRVNAWCISGTPVRKNVNDLLGLLIFLRYEPYASTKHIWTSLIQDHKPEFRTIFGGIALRHSKQSVRDELRLPAQRRYVITMPFTPVEEQHYHELFNQMCEECGLDSQGAPLTDSWNPDSVTDVMRKWLVRLRQTALHPEVGGRNRRALGHKDGPLRTVDQVLEVMLEQTDVAIRTDHRNLLTSKLKRGQLFENSPRVREALDVWSEAAMEASKIVEECRQQLHEETERVSLDEKATGHVSDAGSASSSADEVDDHALRLGTLRNRLRTALEIEHMAIFFKANAYFQIKSNEDMTKPNSPEFDALEKLETECYDKSKFLRREILQENFRKADRLMSTLSKRARTQGFVQIPSFESETPKGGLESRRIVERLDALGAALDAQANQLDEWREQTIQLLIRPLVDEDENLELTGDEYEESTKIQDEVMVFVQALRAVIADRHDTLTGQENLLVEFDVKTALRLAKDGEGASPERLIALMSARKSLKPTKEMGSIRGIVGEFRTIATNLRYNLEDNKSSRAQNELSIIEALLSATQKQLSEQIKATTGLEKEIDFFTSIMNTRLEYYRQLQEVSDQVAPYDGPNNDGVVAKMIEDEARLSRKLATAKSKRRYLLHLKMEATNQEQRICVICQECFEVGALTVCGHLYCSECIKHWWASHRNCPICKRKLNSADLHDITIRPQQLSIQAEEVCEPSQERSNPSTTSRKSAIYSEISKSQLAEIKNIELDGPSFTTKIDTLARHIIYLREADPGAKSIIYSQFKDYLVVLGRAFSRYRIGFSSIDKQNGIERFKKDPGVECFLLHARAHSSGLNLVNASHVFLCEPLLNTALELQAIARVDRIGQHQETNVWLYLVDGTVEESIHQLSVRRRMEHIGKTIAKGKGKGKQKDTIPDQVLDANLEEANSIELQQASLSGLMTRGEKGGELVNKEDLWDCLFGGVGQQRSDRELDSSNLRSDPEVRRHLIAEAADRRDAEDM